MRKNRVIEQNRCYHLVSRLAHRAFFLDDEEKDRAVALMRRVEAGVKASMSYCINITVSISSDPFDPFDLARHGWQCNRDGVQGVSGRETMIRGAEVSGGFSRSRGGRGVLAMSRH